MKTSAILYATAALLLLAGCTQEIKTSAVSDEGSVPLMEGTEACLSYGYDIEYLTGGVPKEVKDKINNHIIRTQILSGEDETGADVPAACKIWEESLVDGYKTDTDDFIDEYDEQQAWMFDWEFKITGKFTSACKARKLQSYCAESSDYTGGAHGMYGIYYTVFDLRTGDAVTEKELFLDGCEEELSELLDESMLNSLGEEDREYLFAGPTPNGNFYVDDAGVNWVYNPYEIAPYAMGTITVSLTWDKLKPFLR
ncbi:MAG: DUF3298 and DUF4163 domain-containing protein [Bacteroidales bacterium]|nr:DUF3298 and DUF4163 domain-containing protein [Bacteroidales bacterium]